MPYFKAINVFIPQSIYYFAFEGDFEVQKQKGQSFV